MKSSKYFYLSSNFLRLAHESALEIVNSGNPAYITSGSPVSDAQFNQAIRWTDHSIGIAALFCFYHGAELIMKGFILEKQPDIKGHKLTQFLEVFESHYPGTLIGQELDQHIKVIDADSPLSNFMSINELGIDSWYQSLKYPEMMGGKGIDHFSLKYNGKSSIEYWRKVAISAANIHNHGNVLLNSLGGA